MTPSVSSAAMVLIRKPLISAMVLDQSRKLVGTVSLRRLLLSQPDELIGEIMHENIITITTRTDQEEVARIFQKYDFTSMPVVDSENRLVGIITVDDVVDIMEQEATEDIEMMAAITPTDKSYMKTGVFETWKKRIPWLLILMISATFIRKKSSRSTESPCGLRDSYIVYPHVYGYRRKCRRTGFCNHYPWYFSGRDRIP